MITVEHTEDPLSSEQIYTVRVPMKDLVGIDLDRIDRAVLAEPASTAADVLQNLQILAFRQSQQAATPPKGDKQ